MCVAVRNAQCGCSTSRQWTGVAFERLIRDYPQITLQIANEVFDGHVLDHAKQVQKKKSKGEDEYIFALIGKAKDGPVYYHFVLDEDPDDPIIKIVSAHEPDHPSLKL